MSDIEDKTQALLASLWLKNRPVIEERLVVLEQASGAASAGSLSQDLRLEAQGTAHKLAGAVGMYGYDDGTRIARELETLLSGAAPDATRLKTLVSDLRNSLFPAN